MYTRIVTGLFIVCTVSLCYTRCDDGNSDLNQAIAEIEACARLGEIEVASVDPAIDSNFFTGVIRNVQLSTIQGFRDYTTKVDIGSIVRTSTRESEEGVLESYRQVVLRISSDGASGSVYIGDPLLSVVVKLPCERNENLSSLSIYQSSLTEGNSYDITSPTSDCDNSVDVTIQPLCHGYSFDQRGAYTGKPFSSIIGNQTGHQFMVNRYRFTEQTDGSYRFQLRATFSANLYYNTTAGGPIEYGTLRDATIDIDQIVFL